MLLDNPFTNDNRVKREIIALTNSGHQIDLVCIDNKKNPIYEHKWGANISREISINIFDIKNVTYKKTLIQKLAKRKFDLIHCHDQEMLNIAVGVKKTTKTLHDKEVKLIYDSHELFHYWPLNISNYDNWWVMLKSTIVRKLQVSREKINSKHIDYLITVNNSLAKDLKKHFNIKSPPCVIRNIPELQNPVKNNILREKFKLSDNTKILVYIGANVYPKTINIEQVIEELCNKKDVAIVIIAKKNNFQKSVNDFCISIGAKNIYFHDIILPEKINKYLSSADIGIVPTWNKKNLSYWYGLDNKLFEYLMAEIPILATQQPEYINIIEKYNVGLCINPEIKNSFWEGFQTVISDREKYKENLIKAKSQLNWDVEKKMLIKFYQSILKDN